MKEYNKKSKVKKAIRITLLTVVGLLLFVSIFIYSIFHNYINKMNFTKSKAAISQEMETASSDMLSEEEGKSPLSELYPIVGSEGYIADSSGTTIDTVQTQLGTYSSVNYTQDTSQLEINNLEAYINKNMESDTEIIKNKKVLNILLIGSDTRNSEERGRSDSMILITINKDSKRIVATSFLRDIYLQIPGKNNNRINAAYAFGGADLLMDTLKQNFKIQIDRYVLVDFSAFIDIIDVIGGIAVAVEDSELDIINDIMKEGSEVSENELNSYSLTKAGTCQLNGKQALSYARNRSSINGDFDRTNRQRKVLIAIYEKVKQQNILELNNLLNIILPQATTNLTESEILTQILSMPAYIRYSLEQWSVPMKGTYTNMRIRNMAVLGIDFEENIKEIQQKLYLDK